MLSLATTGSNVFAFSALAQAGRVRDVAVVTFGPKGGHKSAPIMSSAARLETYADPRTGADLALAARSRVEDPLRTAQAALADSLRAANIGLGGAADVFDAALAGDADAATLGKVPAALQAPLAAYLQAEKSIAALTEGIGTAPASGSALSEEATEKLIARAIADQVDARLAAELVAKRIEQATQRSVLSLFGGDAEVVQRMEALLDKGERLAILGKRKGMIETMTRAVDRGDISVSVCTKTVWADEDIFVSPAAGTDVSVYVSAERAHLAYGSAVVAVAAQVARIGTDP